MECLGILNVYKPAGLTSRNVVDRVERLVRPARVGHAGTLDPLATGVLVICVGQATRLIQYVQRLPKRYRATFLLGQSSNTDDTDGEVTVVAGAVDPTRDRVEQTLSKFVGEIDQRPPTHSAVKLGGHRAYRLARRGAAVELNPRKITIHSIELRRYEYPVLEVEVECGSGTYIRSIGRDLGALLGTGAVMSALERTAVGGFRAEEAMYIDNLTTAIVLEHLQPPLTACGDLPRVTLTRAQVLELRYGRPILWEWVQDSAAAGNLDGWKSAPRGEIAATDSAGRLAAILWE
jgi:tRNA pseudouridine55 synthase